jgi:hypothetical protein
MSDTSFSAVNSGLERAQIYDDEWMMDSLSDDDVDIPKQFEMAEDDDECEDPCLEEKLEAAWDELCLDQFINSLNSATTAGGNGSSNNGSSNGAGAPQGNNSNS